MNINSNNQTGGGESGAPEAVMFDLRSITAEQLARLGMQQVAYVKAVKVNGAEGFAIHAADGTPMAVADELQIAVAAIRDHEMVPVWVH